MNKGLLTILMIIVIAWSCKEKPHNDDHAHSNVSQEDVEVSENQKLYEEVMNVHNEVMPKMDDIHRKKEELKNKIANTPDMSPEKKMAIDATVAKLDSAGESMMAWMRQFNPVPDSAGEEKARMYLEGEMVKVKKVRENILQALKEAEKN